MKYISIFLQLFYDNLCQKKLFTDRQTDGRTTQKYSSEPYKTSQINRLVSFIKLYFKI